MASSLLALIFMNAYSRDLRREVMMASSKSLEHSIERAVKHYSSLFTLPSYTRIVVFTLLMCVAGSILTLFFIADAPIVLALYSGILLFSLSAFSDLIIRQGFFKSDPIYNSRRCAALSMFSLLLWFGFLFVGSLLARILSWSFWFALFSMGFAAVCILRLIVLSSTSFGSYLRIVGASLLHPALCLPTLFCVASSVGHILKSTWLVGFIPAAVLVSILTAHIFIRTVNRLGVETLQTPTTMVLRAFLANWMENLTAPIEDIFERFGKEKTIDFSLLGFRTNDGVKSVVVVPSFHPGPFRNVGSSLLPSIIQEAIENKLHCVAAVPHGLFGHEFDLSSQLQNQRVLEGIMSAADFAEGTSDATAFLKAQKGVAGASCQIFGDCALLTLTLAPETTEDFPRELGDFIVEEAAKLGLKHAIVINAHNSIDGAFDVGSALESLKEAAAEALRKASGVKRQSFELGAARTVPKEFNVEDGMGLGGISALALRVGGQVNAYVVIDGNNMVSGLRDEILVSLEELGVERGEVLTTDTHEVNAIVMTARGYHPLGEAIPHERLISYAKAAVAEALNNMQRVSAAWRAGSIPNVRVIGEKQIEELPSLADKSVQRAKKVAVPLFAAAGLALIALLFVL
jgi:putative membrane protein